MVTRLRYRLAFRDSVIGVADRGDGPLVQEGGLEVVFLLRRDHTPFFYLTFSVCPFFSPLFLFSSNFESNCIDC